MNKAKMTNREIAAMYLAKAAEEDQKKVEAFCKACFTDKVMNDLGFFTISEFKDAGKIVSSVLVKTLNKVREGNELSGSDAVKKSTRGRRPKEVNVEQTVDQVEPETGNPDSQYTMDLENPNVQTGGVIYEQN